MAAGNINAGPLVLWGFLLTLVFIGAAAAIIRIIWSAGRGRRGRGPTDPQLVTDLHR